jgi:hypothetical protein
MPDILGFIGAIVTGKLHSDGSGFTVADSLGSAFIVDDKRGIALTNHHVMSPLPTADDIGLLLHLPPTNQERVFVIDPKRIVRWDDHDLVAFPVRWAGRVPPGLISFPTSAKRVELAEQVTVLGIPKDHNLYLDKMKLSGTIRALTGFVVTVYDEDAEASFPVIKGMSGGPVLSKNQIAGIIYDYRVYAVERYKSESTHHTKDGITRKEIYEAEEVLKFGAFYQYAAFLSWLESQKEMLGAL